MATDVTKEEWQHWRKDKVTLQFLTSLMNQRDLTSEAVLQGVVTGEDRLISIGRCQGIQGAVSLVIEDFDYIHEKEEDNDGS